MERKYMFLIHIPFLTKVGKNAEAGKSLTLDRPHAFYNQVQNLNKIHHQIRKK